VGHFFWQIPQKMQSAMPMSSLPRVASNVGFCTKGYRIVAGPEKRFLNVVASILNKAILSPLRTAYAWIYCEDKDGDVGELDSLQHLYKRWNVRECGRPHPHALEEFCSIGFCVVYDLAAWLFGAREEFSRGKSLDRNFDRSFREFAGRFPDKSCRLK